jgi:hypothetical protein
MLGGVALLQRLRVVEGFLLGDDIAELERGVLLRELRQLLKLIDHH